MTLSYDETRKLINLILSQSFADARRDLHDQLGDMMRAEGEFYAGIVRHGPKMGLTSDQWFDLLSKLPLRILQSDLDLPSILSSEQISRLPSATG